MFNLNHWLSSPPQAWPQPSTEVSRESAPAVKPIYDHTFVLDSTGAPKRLLQPLARGGEGTVIPLFDRPDVLVKIYHPEVLRVRGRELQDKVTAMVALKHRFPKGMSWPQLSVFDEKNQWIGYAMDRQMGVTMARLAHALLYRKPFPDLDRVMVVDYLLSWLRQLECLHSAHIFIGDYNLQNFLCTPGKIETALIDCDSYQLVAQKKFFPSPVGSPDMTPPEHHGKAFRDIVRNDTSEHFSVAIVIFKCLMLGRHPYDSVGGEDPVKNIVAGRFPYGTGNRGVPRGPWYNIWSHMPYRVKFMFVSVFGEGAQDPGARPTLAQWLEVLSVYRRELLKGWHEGAVRPALPKSSEYHGQAAGSASPSC